MHRRGFTHQTSHAPSGKHEFLPAAMNILKARHPKRHPLTVVSFLWGQGTATTTQDVRLKLDTALLLLREDVDGARQSKGISLEHPVHPYSPGSADRGHAAVKLSPATQKARTKVLDIVLTSLRRTGDRTPGSAVELVLQGGSVADFAASLALLLECGQQEEQVVSAGTAFLAENSSSKAVKAHPEALPDVPLCMALAHHRLALAALEAASIFPVGAPHSGATMHGSSGAVGDKSRGRQEGAASSPVAQAYGHVCSALKLLKECGGGKAMTGAAASVDDLLAEPVLDHDALQRQLLDLLLSVAPQYATQLLAPGGPAAAPAPSKQQRERAVEMLRQALWMMQLPEQRLQLMGGVRQELSAAEQLALYENAPVPDPELSEQELYDAALAHIWEGYTQRWPNHVYRADSLLRLISQRTSLGLDVRLERNVCALLLGNVQDYQGDQLPEISIPGASDLLLAETEGPLGSTNGGVEVLHSVNAREEQSTMEDWAQRWLELSIMPCFAPLVGEGSSKEGTTLEGPAAAAALPGGAGAQPQLSVRAYLSSPKVAVFNQVLRHANEQNLRHVTANLQNMSHDALHQLLSLWKSSASTLAQAQQSLMQRSPKEAKEQQQQRQQGMEGIEGPSAAAPPESSPQMEPMVSEGTAVTSADSRSGASTSTAPVQQQYSSSGSSVSDETSPSLYRPVVMPEDYTSDGMAVAAPPSAAGSGPTAGDSALATTAPSTGQPLPSSGVEIPSGPTGLTSSGSEASAAAASSLWVLSGIQSGAIRPRVTARIVDPTASKLTGPQLVTQGGSGGGGSSPMRFALIAVRVTAVAALAVVAWASGRYAVNGDKDVSVATVISQLRVLGKGTASSHRHQEATCSTTVVLASKKAAIEQMVLKCRADTRGAAQLTPTSAMDLLLCWQAACQAPPSEGQPLLPLVLRDEALRQSQSAVSGSKKQQPQRTSAAAAAATCNIEVLSVQTDEPLVDVGPGSAAAVVLARIATTRGGAAEALPARRVQQVAVGLSREGGAEGPWRIASINELSGS